jgi:TonB-dependent SusC/RagA subfamily outer membrane receptor
MATLAWRAVPIGALALYAAGCAHSNATAGQAQLADTTRVARDTTHRAHPPQRNPSTVTGIENQVAPGDPVELALQGTVPGLDVTRTPDGGVAIRIHGPSSFFGSSEPMFVLDGIPITPGPNGRITGLNARDVESIQVLKDPSETALYGVRGGNGVILIKTKTAQVKPKPQ